ncbi:MAG: hypothetical protein M3247_07750, partial [Thermoproteota archaeon]|nr:hypothetical protein [Thermoproteota archaeon]
MGIIEDTFSNPIVTLVIGTLVSVGLIPYFSSRWQIHQKGLEIRLNLVGRMSKAIMEMMAMIEIFQKLLPKEKSTVSSTTQKGIKAHMALEESFETLKKKFAEFKVDSEVIRTELDAYFSPDVKIGEKWEELIRYIERFYERTKDDFEKEKLKSDDLVIKSISRQRKMRLYSLCLPDQWLDFRLYQG